MSFKRKYNLLAVGILIVIINLIPSSCSVRSEITATAIQPQVAERTSVAPTLTVVPTITLTPEPLALTINGVGIPQVEYDAQKAQLLRAMQTTGITLTDEEVEQMLLDYFVDMELLAQAAYDDGYMLNDEALEQRINELRSESGGDTAFQSWLTENGLSEGVFRSLYSRELAASWKRDEIISTVGDTADQVHARQILVFDSELADQIYRQLQGGADFATLAEDYDPLTKGELGWFPRGYLFLPEIEDALFALQPGQYTEVIQSDYGFHIIQVVEREGSHPLSSDARQAVRHQIVSQWLEEQRARSTIEPVKP